MHRILVTGVSGFLGSHIAQNLINNGLSIIGLKRKSTDLWRCREFEHKVDWVDLDDHGAWKQKVILLNPGRIIHCAWIGVAASDRDDWENQMLNIHFLGDLIEISSSIHISKFVFLGSQAEYGKIDGIISENATPQALNAYSSVKLACLEILKTFCQTNQVEWIWLRVFSVFGEKEDDNWLIPSMVKSMIEGNEMDFTEGNQKYAYLYVKDFASIVLRILTRPVKSGIYNVSSNYATSIRSLIKTIRDRVNPKFKLNFGALSYRENQSMHIEGDISKLKREIGEIEFTNFNAALQNTMEYYISKRRFE